MASLTEIYNELVTEVEMEKEAEATESSAETTDEITKVASDWVAAGRLMAIGYYDEMTKLAGTAAAAGKAAKGAKKAAEGLMSKVWKGTKEYAVNPMGAKQNIDNALHAKRLSGTTRALEALKGAGKYAAAPAGVAGAGYGAYKLSKKD